jgi:hypothetical protein
MFTYTAKTIVIILNKGMFQLFFYDFLCVSCQRNKRVGWYLFFSIFFFQYNSFAQQRVFPLINSISVDSIFEIKPYATKISYDEKSGHLFYSVITGDIYEVFMNSAGGASDSLRYSVVDHGISSLQGLYFREGILYLSGNNWTSTTGVGIISKGTPQANGTRLWETVVSSDPYPSASPTGDHGFSGISLDPSGNFLFVSSGARTHLGEMDDNNGAWPNCRETPMTCRMFRFPISSLPIHLVNDSLWLENSGFIYASGTRNAYDFAWDGNDTLFSIDNSGERDDPEELNWIRQGKNYGFPWNMGGNINPLVNSPYNYLNDPLVNPNCGGVAAGWFLDDPTFPTLPSNVTFMEPVRNYGVSADYYRDATTGMVKKASDEGTYVSTFTPHASPLGLVFDKDSLLASPFRGDGFVLSFMPGGDSTGFSTISPWGIPCPFVDPSRELRQLKLVYDAVIDNYTMTTSDLVSGFYLPVDAVFVGNELYVIERGGDMWKVTFPLYQEEENELLIYPNPSDSYAFITFNNDAKELVELSVVDFSGKKVVNVVEQGVSQFAIKTNQLACGIYICSLKIGSANAIHTNLLVK